MVDNIQAYIYIYHLGLRFDLPTLPSTTTDSMPISFQETPVLARSAPQITYASAGPRSVQIRIPIHRQLFSLENPIIEARVQRDAKFRVAGPQYVDMPDPVTGQTVKVVATDAADYLINALLSLSLPKYLDISKAIVPPSVLIRYGNELAIRGVPQQLQKTTEGPWLKSGKQALVTITFDVKEVEPYSAQYVAQNGSLRGISTTLERSSVWQY